MAHSREKIGFGTACPLFVGNRNFKLLLVFKLQPLLIVDAFGDKKKTYA